MTDTETPAGTDTFDSAEHQARLKELYRDFEAAGMTPLWLTRGPYTIRGYYKAAEQNARSFTPDGWYRSGDICRFGAGGNLIVEGRDKDMINRGGEKISAEEVENLVYRVPGVSQVAAVAMPDPALGERVCLYVVPQADCEVTLSLVRKSMEDAGVARFKLPEHLVVTDALPVTKVGKIDKKALRADIAARSARLRSRGQVLGAAMAVIAPSTVAPAQNTRASTYPDSAGRPACAEATISAAASWPPSAPPTLRTTVFTAVADPVWSWGTAATTWLGSAMRQRQNPMPRVAVAA